MDKKTVNKISKTFAAIVKQAETLRPLIKKVSLLEEINQAIQVLLSPEEAANLWAAELIQGNLILATSSPVWNHKFRFLRNDLLNELRKNPKFCGISSIKIVVQYLPNKEDLHPEAKKPNYPELSMSAASAESILQAANAVDGKSAKLAAALRSLATKAQK